MSGHLTLFFSMFSKSSFEYELLNEISPTDETNALILIFPIICLAIDPATTLQAVSLAELLPPPL